MYNLRAVTLSSYPTKPEVRELSPERTWIRTYPVNVNKPWDDMGENEEHGRGDETRLPVDVGDSVHERGGHGARFGGKNQCNTWAGLIAFLYLRVRLDPAGRVTGETPDQT